jgi:hypothetical protein
MARTPPSASWFLPEVDLFDPQFFEQGLRGFGEDRQPLDGKHARSQGVEDGRLVSRARPHLQDLLPPRQGELLRHEGDHVGLGDRLAVADGEGVVVVGEGPGRRGNETMPGDLGEGAEHAPVANPPALELGLDHPAAVAVDGILVRIRFLLLAEGVPERGAQDVFLLAGLSASRPQGVRQFSRCEN